MSGSHPVRYGVSVAGIAVAVLALLVSCTDAPVSPKPEGFSIRPPLALISPVFSRLQFLGFVLDDAGANDTPAQSDLNAFTRADNLPDTIGVKWIWDDVDSWTGSGQTGDACALFDTDNDSKANAAVCVRISNPNGDPTIVSQLAFPASPLVYTCGDNKKDRCAQPATLQSSLGGTVCEVEKIAGETFFSAGEDGADVLAACVIPLAAIGASSTPNLINVCSFPSGSPNSNPFDCVVTPGAGFLVIKKATTPQSSGLTFNFKVNPRVVVDSLFSITDNSSQDEATSILAAVPGTYSVAELSLSAGWALDSAACVQQGATPTSTGTKSGSTVSGVAIASGKTTVCRFVNKVVAPTISVVKTATPNSIPETGDSVSYSVLVTNSALIAVTLDSIKDNVFGNLSGTGSCNSGGNPYGTIAASGGTYTCSFKKLLAASQAGQTHINQVTSYVSSTGGPASASDTALVTYTDVLPDISVVKAADYLSITATGGDSVSGFIQDARFARGTSGSGGGVPIFLTNICDDHGVNDINAAQSDLNCFSRADNISGHIGLRWSWDAIAQWTGSGQTGDACALLDTNNNGSANFAFCVRIYNPTPTTIAQVVGSPVLYKCKDSQPDRCASPNSIQAITNSTCSIAQVPNRMAGGDDGDDIEATCNVDLNDLANNVVIANVDLLNVCSFPSGSPGSNSFDCVVTPASGFLVLVDSTTSSSDAYFAFTLRNAGNTAADTATNGDDKWEVQSGATSPGLPIPVGNHSIVQGLPTSWTLGSITCTLNGNNVGTTNLANLAKLSVPIEAGQTTTCTFVNSLSASQTVTFTVTVTNNSAEAVNLFSLEDSENPDAGTPTYSTLSGAGTCNGTGNLFGSIAGSGGTYSCTFTRTVSGPPGTQHKDKVRAVGKDNENNSDTEISNKITVTIN